MKPIHFSNHARKRMIGRGATESEIIETIQAEKWQPALQNKVQARRTLKYEQPSPINQKVYAFKTIHAIFVDEDTAITVVTVLVYYGD